MAVNPKLQTETKKYISETSVEKRKERGQFFTPQPLCEELIEEVPLEETADIKILDPASGTGEMLLASKEKYPNSEVIGWEKDEQLVDITSNLDFIDTIIHTDSLEYKTKENFDLIIGNPPYYEIGEISDEFQERYEEVIYGRTNIYSLFIYKAINLLREGGYLAFIVPKSLNTGTYFKKVREYITETCSIEHLSVKTETDIFEDASQEVIKIVLKKGGDSDDYIFERNGTKIFSEDAERLKELYEKRVSLSEIGYEVKTGKLVWNQEKDELTQETFENETPTVPIIWSQSIEEDGKISYPDCDKKRFYSGGQEHNTGPSIFVNRTIGNRRGIKAGIIQEEVKFIAENHVNVIKPIEDEEQKLSMEEIKDQLNSDEAVKILQKVTGTAHLSKKELVHLFPLKM